MAKIIINQDEVFADIFKEDTGSKDLRRFVHWEHHLGRTARAAFRVMVKTIRKQAMDIEVVEDFCGTTRRVPI